MLRPGLLRLPEIPLHMRHVATCLIVTAFCRLQLLPPSLPEHYLQIISVQLLLFGPPLLLVGEDLPVGLLLGQAALLGQVAALALPRPLLLTIADLSQSYSSSFTAGLRDRHKR